MKRIYLTKPASYLTKGGQKARAPADVFVNFPDDEARKLVDAEKAKWATDANEITDKEPTAQKKSSKKGKEG